MLFTGAQCRVYHLGRFLCLNGEEHIWVKVTSQAKYTVQERSILLKNKVRLGLLLHCVTGYKKSM